MKVKTKPSVKRQPKPLSNPSFNIHHPDLSHMIEKAFKSGPVQYYKFIDDKMMPAGRYRYIYASLKEADLRMTLDTLQSFMDTLENILNGGARKNNINVGDIWKIIINMKSRIALGFEPDSVKRVAALLYFDETEDLSTYSKAHGAKKVELWEKYKTMDFFLTMPIVDLFGLNNISISGLEESIQEKEEILRILTEDLQKVSSENSSESGKSPS